MTEQVLPVEPCGVWRHVKRGTTYEVVGLAQLQIATCDVVEGSALVVYRGDDGKLWAREEGEFLDGRFERAPANAAPVVGMDAATIEACAAIAERHQAEEEAALATTKAVKERHNISGAIQVAGLIATAIRALKEPRV